MGTANVFSTFDPTSLFAGEFPARQRPVVLDAGQNVAGVPLPRGTLLGRLTTGTASAAVKASGANTGNGTIALAGTPVISGAIPGIYQIVFTAPTAFTVYDPTGAQVGTGAPASAFSDEIAFTITAGGVAFVAGDGFAVTADPSDSYVICKANASNGSQTPVAILAADTDTSGGAITTPAYFEGEFAYEIMNIDASWTLAALDAVLRQNLSQLYVRSVGVLG